jgi:hypothetical protein
MASIYDEIEIEDFDYNQEENTYYYPCPCGDRFQITLVSPTILLLQALMDFRMS